MVVFNLYKIYNKGVEVIEDIVWECLRSYVEVFIVLSKQYKIYYL